MVQISADNQIQ